MQIWYNRSSDKYWIDSMTDMKNERALIFGAIAAAIIIMSTAVFPFWNLFPRMVTGNVKVIYIDSSGCTIETPEGIVTKIPSCGSAKAGENTTASYDAKIAERHKQI